MDVSFERNKQEDEWLTPPEIIKSLGEFYLDPCFDEPRPWETAQKYYTSKEDGLLQEWKGKVWCNPPYGQETNKWLKKMSEHNNGIILIFARTETEQFFKYIWKKATSVLFIKGRLRFYDNKGNKANNSAGAPSVLVAYGKECSEALRKSKIKGKYIRLR